MIELVAAPEHAHEFRPFVLRDYEPVAVTKRRGFAPQVWVTWYDWYVGFICADCNEPGYEVPAA